MDLDLIFVTYNSSKWIKNCFKYLSLSEYDLKKINIYVVDNCSKDNTLPLLYEVKSELNNKVNNFIIIENEKNTGFGDANNLAFHQGKSDIVVFVNIDTELFSDSLKKLAEDIHDSSEDIGIWEMRQIPFELPKFYNPLNMTTNWSSGAAFAIKREIFHSLKGFDKQIFMYCEDVDLSWRVQSLGYKIKYVPKARIKHFAYEDLNVVKPNAYLNCFKNNLLLRYRYGQFADVIYGHLKFIHEIVVKKELYKGAKKQLLVKYLEHFKDIKYFLKTKISDDFNFVHFNKLGYGISRDSGEYVLHLNDYKNEFINIFVDKKIYTENMQKSLENQTYKLLNLYIIDFENERDSFEQIRHNINKAKYISFILDENVSLFPDHYEILINESENSNTSVRSIMMEQNKNSKNSNNSLISNYLFKNKAWMSDAIQLCSNLEEFTNIFSTHKNEIQTINKATILKSVK